MSSSSPPRYEDHTSDEPASATFVTKASAPPPLVVSNPPVAMPVEYVYPATYALLPASTAMALPYSPKAPPRYEDHTSAEPDDATFVTKASSGQPP